MTFVYEPPMNLMLATLFFLIASGSAWRGAQLLVKGICQAAHPSGSLWLVRGIRGVIIAVGMWALSGGVLLASKGLLVFGAIFLGEELYETGVVLLALRAGLKATQGQPSSGCRGAGDHALKNYRPYREFPLISGLDEPSAWDCFAGLAMAAPVAMARSGATKPSQHATCVSRFDMTRWPCAAMCAQHNAQENTSYGPAGGNVS
jgi:hypothetical protein